jgi:cytosine deaminase
VAFLASHLLWMTTYPDMETLYDMITVNPAKCINVPSFGLAEGNDANLVVLDAQSVCEAFRYHKAPAHVISHGKLLDPADFKD